VLFPLGNFWGATMDLKSIVEMMEGRIEELETTVYAFESVIKPRADADKEILEKLRADHLKVKAIKEKEERGEEVTQEEIYEAIPESLR